ncbi:MAG: TonB-dependent receptor [Acidobacteria bacterium]|nr:TonB-dependent receptor [Acidobacteriota bacterium]MBW4045058.1 TonB-dependent receptor [Acidobacteriota bacterium]
MPSRPLARKNHRHGYLLLHAVWAFLAASLFSLASWCQQPSAPAWEGTLRDYASKPIGGAAIELSADGHKFHTLTAADGHFLFEHIPAGIYQLSVKSSGHTARYPQPLNLATPPAHAVLTLTPQGVLAIAFAQSETVSAKTEGTGGEALSSSSVSQLPLNKRDFSQLLLLAAGTMTDSNGANNFTQQFAINGQRGVEATFAMDGADTSDPEMGGATFSNFNVDAVQEIQSSSGWMPAEIGRGAAGFTNILTRSGSNDIHGSVFEFLRNSALDARNYFDHSSIANPGRIPPFRRNEFGFTNGGPVVLPHLYDGRRKTFYYGEYQGFRQVLGTTQVLPVPTAQERAGQDSTAYPGDTLFVPVNAQIARVLARYPLPNFPEGAYGVHTFATSSKVVTNADQFSVRIDQQIGARNHLFARVTYDNLTGPTTNPDQTVIDPSFGIQYIDRQRNLAVDYTRTLSPKLELETEFSITRTTPSFPTTNRTDPAVKFNDGLFEAFNSAAGSVMTAFGNLFQLQQSVSYVTGKHSWKFGGELRFNRDTTYFGISPNGEYDFGGGTAYSPVNILSQSGAHTIHAGDPLPDTLSSLLTGSPFAYTVAVAPPYFSNGPHIGPAAITRNAGDLYLQDTWKLSDRFTLDYGLRYERYSAISERAHRTSGVIDTTTSPGQEFVVNPRPAYNSNQYDWGPRVQLDWRANDHLHMHAGGGLTTIPPNIWQDNFLTGSTPFVIYPRLTASRGAGIAYGFQITPSQLPHAYTPGGQDIFPTGDTSAVAPNTVMDINRYERDIASLSPNHQITPLNISAIDQKFTNGYLATWTVGLERTFANLTADANYVGTAGIRLPRISFPNAYPGADPQFAPYTQFDSSGTVTGGFGTEQLVTGTAHSTYHALQLSLQGNIAHGGPGVQASYTWSKSIDDTSSVSGGFITGASGAVAQAFPQNPFDTHAEKGPSTFDITHAFTLSLAQDLHLESVSFLRPVYRKVTAGWELLSISTITSGAPFTIYSGIQQTGVGSMGVDRPDQIATPQLSTARKKREDYFGRGADNASYFSVPIHVPGGTGPNQGRFGTLGRDTFRGPAYYDYDFSLIKDTPFGARRGGGELADLQFRAEFFNLFNIVNMGLPANNILGSGFGVISRTAGTSRQIQFSLKVIY